MNKIAFGGRVSATIFTYRSKEASEYPIFRDMIQDYKDTHPWEQITYEGLISDQPEGPKPGELAPPDTYMILFELIPCKP